MPVVEAHGSQDGARKPVQSTVHENRTGMVILHLLVKVNFFCLDFSFTGNKRQKCAAGTIIRGKKDVVSTHNRSCAIGSLVGGLRIFPKQGSIADINSNA